MKIKRKKLTGVKLRRKNPKNLSKTQILNHLTSNLDVTEIFPLIRGGEGEIFHFSIIKNTHIFEHLMYPGEYVIKVYDLNDYVDQQKLIKLSKYGLIPKIYYIDSNTIIMKYIKGVRIHDFVRKIRKEKWDPIIFEQLYNKMKNLFEIWKKLGFSHGDAREQSFLEKDPIWMEHNPNVLVSYINGKLKLYLIDPDARLNSIGLL